MIHLKNDRDVAFLRKSADLVSRTLAEVAAHVKPGVTTKELDEIAEAFIRSHGARAAFKGYDPGWGGGRFPGVLCTSVNDVVVHGFPTDVPLKDGDIVSVDCGVELNGYYGDSAYTFAVGEISEEKRRLCAVTYESLMLAVEQAVVGKRMGDLSFAVQEHCERHGMGVVRDLVGHGIGKHLHEKPSVPNFGKRGTGLKLKPGLAICIEPMVTTGTYKVKTDADKWTVRSEDGTPAAHYEHTVVVQRGRAEVLTTFEYIEEKIEAPYREVING